jgi:hypothetical protein
MVTKDFQVPHRPAASFAKAQLNSYEGKCLTNAGPDRHMLVNLPDLGPKGNQILK